MFAFKLCFSPLLWFLHFLSCALTCESTTKHYVLKGGLNTAGTSKMRLWLPALLQQIKAQTQAATPISLCTWLCPEESLSENINAFFQNVQSHLIENAKHITQIKIFTAAIFRIAGNRLTSPWERAAARTEPPRSFLAPWRWTAMSGPIAWFQSIQSKRKSCLKNGTTPIRNQASSWPLEDRQQCQGLVSKRSLQEKELPWEQNHPDQEPRWPRQQYFWEQWQSVHYCAFTIVSNRNDSGSLAVLDLFKIGFKLSLFPRFLHFLYCALIIVMMVQLITGQGWINTSVLFPRILGSHFFRYVFKF